MEKLDWSLCIAIAALIGGTGKFLDDYHIRSSAKSKTRDLLVRAFIALDKRAVPDMGGYILRISRHVRSLSRYLLIPLVALVAAWAVISVFYLARRVNGPPLQESYALYIWHWIPLTGKATLLWLSLLGFYVVPAVLATLALSFLFHRASTTAQDWKRLPLLVGGLAAACAVVFAGTAVIFLCFGDFGYAAPFVAMASLSSIIPALLVTVTTLLLIIVRLSLLLFRYILLHIFDVASSPTNSPFTYASSLLSIAVLLFKLMETIFRAKT
jgi:hypothetical protein